MYSINYIDILRMYLPYFTIQMKYLQGQHNAGFKTQSLLASHYLKGSAVRSGFIFNVNFSFHSLYDYLLFDLSYRYY